MSTQLAEQIDTWRTKHGLTQKAAAAQLEVSVRTLENWNQGRYIPKGFALKSLLEKITVLEVKK